MQKTVNMQIKRPYDQAFPEQETSEDLKRRRTNDNWGASEVSYQGTSQYQTHQNRNLPNQGGR